MQTKRAGRQTVQLSHPPSVVSFANTTPHTVHFFSWFSHSPGICSPSGTGPRSSGFRAGQRVHPQT